MDNFKPNGTNAFLSRVRIFLDGMANIWDFSGLFGNELPSKNENSFEQQILKLNQRSNSITKRAVELTNNG